MCACIVPTVYLERLEVIETGGFFLHDQRELALNSFLPGTVKEMNCAWQKNQGLTLFGRMEKKIRPFRSLVTFPNMVPT